MEVVSPVTAVLANKAETPEDVDSLLTRTIPEEGANPPPTHSTPLTDLNMVVHVTHVNQYSHLDDVVGL